MLVKYTMTALNGPISATDTSSYPFGDPSTTSYNYYLSTGGDTIRVATDWTPTTSSDAGYKGELRWDSTYLYICIATNTWRRVAHSTF